MVLHGCRSFASVCSLSPRPTAVGMLLLVPPVCWWWDACFSLRGSPPKGEYTHPTFTTPIFVPPLPLVMVPRRKLLLWPGGSSEWQQQEQWQGTWRRNSSSGTRSWLGKGAGEHAGESSRLSELCIYNAPSRYSTHFPRIISVCIT